MTYETKISLEKYSNRKKHEYFASIYGLLHNNYNSDTKVYSKPVENFDFVFKNNKLEHSTDTEFNLSNAKVIFPELKDQDINPNIRPTQEKISYYLSNRMVPVSLFE